MARTPGSRRVRAMLLVAVACLIGRNAYAQEKKPGADAVAIDTAAVLASARPEIEAANAAWLPGLEHRDAAAIVAAYADSGLFVAPDGSVIRGRDAVARMYQARFTRLGKIHAGGIVQGGIAVVSASLLYEWGSGWLEMTPSAGGAPVRTGGKYLTVWQRQGDGHWRIVRNLSL